MQDERIIFRYHLRYTHYNIHTFLSNLPEKGIVITWLDSQVVHWSHLRMKCRCANDDGGTLKGKKFSIQKR